MNVTLAFDGELLKEARKVAQAMGRSVNQLIREYLAQITRRDDSGLRCGGVSPAIPRGERPLEWQTMDARRAA